MRNDDDRDIVLGLVGLVLGVCIGVFFTNLFHQAGWTVAHQPENAWRMYQESKIDEAATNAKAGLK